MSGLVAALMCVCQDGWSVSLVSSWCSSSVVEFQFSHIYFDQFEFGNANFFTIRFGIRRVDRSAACMQECGVAHLL